MAMALCLSSSPTSWVAPSARRTADFQPSIWGDTFVSYTHDETVLSGWREEAGALKREVQKMLIGGDNVLNKKQCSAKLCLIDSIQRLGVAYHFEEEIEKELHHTFNIYDHDKIDHGVVDDEDDLYAAALEFRLLREHGYRVTCEIFRKFMDKNNKFKESVGEDPRGMLSLYEAAHLRIHGEDILDEALSFTTTRLQSMLPQLTSSFADQVLHALDRPMRRCLPRLDAIYYFSVYEEHKDVQNQALLRFAKLDFNILQKMHQEELSFLSKWWNDLDFARKLPFARDRLVECYFWILGVYFEPQYAQARKFLTKLIAMTSVVDDIYDAYGTEEELELFTEAVDRWDEGAINDLPEYMKIYYRALLDVYRRMEEEMISQGKPLYGVECSKEAMRSVIRCYHEETKWVDEAAGFPKYEDYLKVALISSGYPMLAISSLVGMDANREAFDWLLSEPKINKASAMISRLMDDIVSHKFEQERGHSPSAVECFMRQHKVSEAEACKNLKLDVESAWKDVNEAFLRPTQVSDLVLTRLLNFCRVMDVLYKDSDGYTHVNATVKGQIVSMLSTTVQL